MALPPLALGMELLLEAKCRLQHRPCEPRPQPPPPRSVGLYIGTRTPHSKIHDLLLSMLFLFSRIFLTTSLCSTAPLLCRPSMKPNTWKEHKRLCFLHTTCSSCQIASTALRLPAPSSHRGKSNSRRARKQPPSSSSSCSRGHLVKTTKTQPTYINICIVWVGVCWRRRCKNTPLTA